MHIKRVEIYGFKSFPYKTVIPLERGITAIVGPNGSGKSNILDAIKWVLGEQSSKRLRVKELADLIFSGNSDKKIDFAEVKLVLSHNPPLIEKFREFEEITVIRRFYRDGESEFLINNRPCRLRDIQFLFLSLGVNPNSYGIIDQGEINKFLEISPTDRRFYLEELAGVSRLRISKEEIEKKLNLTKSNLERINDIIREVENQYILLKNQAEIAKEYIKIRENYLKTKNKYLTIKIKKIEMEREKKEEEINKLTKDLKFIEKEITELEDRERTIINKITYLDKKKKDYLREKEEIDKQIKTKKKEIEEINSELYKINEMIKRNRLTIEIEEKRLKDLKNQKEKNNEEIKKTKEKENELKKILREITEKLNSLEAEYNQYNKELSLKRKILDELNKEIISKTERKKSLLSEKIKIENNLKATEKNLNEKRKLMDIILEDIDNNKKKLKYNEEEIEREKKNLDRLFAELNDLAKESGQIKEKINELRSKITSLFEKEKFLKKILSEFNKKYEKELEERLLGNFLTKKGNELRIYEIFLKDYINSIIINDISEINDLVINFEVDTFILRKDVEKLNFEIEYIYLSLNEYLSKNKNEILKLIITKDNFLLTPNGFIIRLSEKNKGFFTLKKELIEIMNESQKIKNKLSEFENNLEKKLKAIKEKEKEKIEIEFKIKNLSDEKLKIEKNIIFLEQKYEHLKNTLEDEVKKIEILKKEKDKIEEELSKIEQELKTLNHKIIEINSGLQESKLELSELEKLRKNILNKIHMIEKDLIKSENEIKNLAKRGHEIDQELLKIEKNLKESKHYLEKLEIENNYYTEKNKEKKEELFTIEEKLNSINISIKEIEKEFSIYNQELIEITKTKGIKEKEIKIIEKKIHNLEIELTELKLTLENLLKEKDEIVITDNVSLIYDIDREDLNVVERDLKDLNEKLKNFKDVNISSIKEFEKIKERYENLMTQKEDIERSITEFEQLLSDIERDARARMIKTLEEVNKNLQEIFPLIFENSQANLTFTGEDPLSGGLDLIIKIPHKNIRNLYMLSGGEKALCVIALLLAFYLTKPGPFCILDEIDAPLDEKNSLKFIRLISKIKEKSQIILISHNPHVIKEVDNIIGVTMEEKGVSKVIKLELNRR